MPPDQILSHSLLFGLAVGAMFLGLAGIVLPLVPGLPLVWAATLAYALLDGFRTLDGWTFAFLTLIAALGVAADFAASHVGAQRSGASVLANLASVAGGIAGLIVLNLPGMLLGAALAVFLVEWLRRREPRAALRASAGWLAGWLAGRGMQMILALFMIAVFVARVLIAARFG